MIFKRTTTTADILVDGVNVSVDLRRRIGSFVRLDKRVNSFVRSRNVAIIESRPELVYSFVCASNVGVIKSRPVRMGCRIYVPRFRCRREMSLLSPFGTEREERNEKRENRKWQSPGSVMERLTVRHID